MDVEHMLGSIISGALTGKRKRRRGATRFLTGGKGSLLNAGTLLAMAGVAWGIYETATAKQGGTSAQAASPWSGAQGPGTPPQGPAAPPPLPAGAASAASAPVPPAMPDVPPEIVRLVRLTISAARADGTLTSEEEASILEHAKNVGAEAIVQRELKSSFALSQIAAGVVDPTQREEMYTLAFAIVRGDEHVTGGERIFLAQLAHQLGLDAQAVARLETDAATKIDAAAGPAAGPGAES